MATPVNVKASLKLEEHHMLEIHPTTHSLIQLKDDIKKIFPLLNQDNIDLLLYWRDRDGDKISMYTDADLRQAIKSVNGKLQIDIQVSYISPSQARQPQRTISASLESQYDVRNPPVSSRPPESVAYQPAVEYTSRNVASSSYDSKMDSNVFYESIPRQTSSQSEPDCDQLDIPSNSPLIEGWPTTDNYALNMISKKLKKNLDDNYLSDNTYDTDSGRQCRVLCILNKDSGAKPIYQGSNMDTECTFLQQLSKKSKWRLQIHKNKTSDEILQIFDDEIATGFETYHSLFVIIITRGDRFGIYGTQGRRIEYFEITQRFDQVPALQGKPKIFLIDDCEIGSDIHDEMSSRGVQQTEISQSPITSPKEFSRMLHNGIVVTGDQRDSVAVSDICEDTYLCKASTLGRCDKIVKGSWAVGALISVMCTAGSRMTFQKMMMEVNNMLEDAQVPEGKANPKITVTNTLTKDLYLLPPPS